IRNLGSLNTFNIKSESFARDVKASKIAIQNKYEQLQLKTAVNSEDLTEELIENYSGQLTKFREAQLVAQNIQNLHVNEKNISKQIDTFQKKLNELNGQQKLLDTQAQLA